MKTSTRWFINTVEKFSGVKLSYKEARGMYAPDKGISRIKMALRGRMEAYVFYHEYWSFTEEWMNLSFGGVHFGDEKMLLSPW